MALKQPIILLLLNYGPDGACSDRLPVVRTGYRRQSMHCNGANGNFEARLAFYIVGQVFRLSRSNSNYYWQTSPQTRTAYSGNRRTWLRLLKLKLICVSGCYGMQLRAQVEKSTTRLIKKVCPGARMFLIYR